MGIIMVIEVQHKSETLAYNSNALCSTTNTKLN